MQAIKKRGKLLPVEKGYLVCPYCLRNKKMVRVRPDTRAETLQVFCRDCKREMIVDIEKGQCFESRGR